MPTARAMRPAQLGRRFRAALTPSRTAASISSNPIAAPPGASSTSATYTPIAAMDTPRVMRATAVTALVMDAMPARLQQITLQCKVQAASPTPDASHQAIPDRVAIEEHRPAVVADVIVVPVHAGYVEADPTIADDEEIAGDAAARPEVAEV